MSWHPPPFDLNAHMAERRAKETEAARMKALEKARDPRGPFWLRFHVWFFTLTLVYTLLATGNDQHWLPSSTGAGTWFGNLIGLFVPIGPNNFAFIFINPLAWIAVALIVFTLARANSYIESFRPNPRQKIFNNIVTLLMLTVTTDILMFGAPMSLIIFVHSLLWITTR